MSQDRFEEKKKSLLVHVQQIFEQMEEEMVMSHQEKYTLLEDVLEQASDETELRVAFDQWYIDHSEEVEFDHNSEELWDHAINRLEEDDEDGEQNMLSGEDDDEDDIDW